MPRRQNPERTRIRPTYTVLPVDDLTVHVEIGFHHLILRQGVETMEREVRNRFDGTPDEFRRQWQHLRTLIYGLGKSRPGRLIDVFCVIRNEQEGWERTYHYNPRGQMVYDSGCKYLHIPGPIRIHRTDDSDAYVATGTNIT